MSSPPACNLAISSCSFSLVPTVSYTAKCSARARLGLEKEKMLNENHQMFVLLDSNTIMLI